MNKQSGFSLVELLVVVIIIAIIAAIAIPNLLASRKAANEASAISTLRTYHSAETTYLATTGGGTKYGLSTDLTGLVDDILDNASPSKSGYDFTVTVTPSTSISYCAIGTPTATGGTNHYGVSIDGVIYKKATAMACADGSLTTTGGAPIQ